MDSLGRLRPVKIVDNPSQTLRRSCSFGSENERIMVVIPCYDVSESVRLKAGVLHMESNMGWIQDSLHRYWKNVDEIPSGSVGDSAIELMMRGSNKVCRKSTQQSALSNRPGNIAVASKRDIRQACNLHAGFLATSFRKSLLVEY